MLKIEDAFVSALKMKIVVATNENVYATANAVFLASESVIIDLFFSIIKQHIYILYTWLALATTCSYIGDFKNGYVTYSPDNFFGSSLIYECNTGYTLIGNKIRICEGDGWWSGTSPLCIKEGKKFSLFEIFFFYGFIPLINQE